MITIKNKRFIVVIVYIRPKSNIKLIKNVVSQIHSNILEIMKKRLVKEPILFVGDFNLNIRDNSNDEFLHFMSNIGYTLQNDRFASTTINKSCIDLIFTIDMSIKLQPYISYFSYHLPMLGKFVK